MKKIADQKSKSSQKKKLILCVTGSVATIKTAELIELLESWAEVKLIATQSAVHFLKTIPKFKTDFESDNDEWQSWKKKGDTVLHIEHRNSADILLIAPLTANTLGKIRFGLCDNLLTSICRAWDFSKPAFIAPAMNTFMWEHPTTKPTLTELKKWGYKIIPPISKTLACGDEGVGAMAEPYQINEFLLKNLKIKN